MGNTTHKNNAANLKWKNDKSFIDFLKKYPNVQVEIAGHTDSDADEKHNQKLSQNRAIYDFKGNRT